MNDVGTSFQYRTGEIARARLVSWCSGLLRWASLMLLALTVTASTPGGRVVVLVERGASIYVQAQRGFEQSFRARDGDEVVFIRGSAQELDSKFEELRAQPPRLVIAIGTQVAKAAKARLPGVPILYCLALNPLQNQLVGPDVGGITLDVALSQQFAEIQKILPRVQRIGVIYDEATSGHLVRQAQQYLKGPLHLIARDARTAQQAGRSIDELMGQIDAFWLLWDPVIANPANFKLLVESSIRNKVALIAPAAPFVEAGALLSVGPDYVKTGRQLGSIALQVLDGKRAGDFQAEPPSDTMLTINGPVARQLGIPIPPNLRAEILAPGGAR
jgi:putative tryptophan/tyrosine transport system substrate-binding protein